MQVLCFDLLTPPVLEEIDFNRPTTGDKMKDERKSRRRIGSLHPGHETVAPYAHQLRILLYNDSNVDAIERFASLCKTAGLANPINFTKYPRLATIEAHRRDFFSSKRLHKICTWLKTLDWKVAFQLECLLHNALLNTDDLLVDLYLPINRLCRDHDAIAAEVLRYFNEALLSKTPQESHVHCFERIIARALTMKRPKLTPGMFVCHHVTFTPTRMILEGPYATQSNRVIRRYVGYEENFLRVDFRDEDRLQYRWAREVDGISFLRERVGGILKNGFELAGRKFEFLAYSSSALREHAVWFMHPFKHETDGWITSDGIRKTLGDFRGVLKNPSKYAARLAQAFTATDPSVKIGRDQWEEIEDMGTEPYLFTDGVGTVSGELGDMIWGALCAARSDHGERTIKPSAVSARGLVCLP